MDTKMNLKLFLVALTLGVLLSPSSASAQEEVVYLMNGVRGVEYRFLPQATDDVSRYFKEIPK